MPKASQVHVAELVALEVQLGDAQVAGILSGAIAALGDKQACVGVVEGEALLDGAVVQTLVAEEIMRGSSEVESLGVWHRGGY